MLFEKYLKSLIKKEGPISLARYMEIALSHEKYGYYRNKDPLGKRGDFITAPEISQVFGELIGVWLATCWSNIGSPKDVAIVELGGGRGTLMKDILRTLRKVPELYSESAIHIVEINQRFKKLQKEALSDFGLKTSWHEDFSTIPDKPILLIANEFFDALPIHQFVMTKDGWREKMVYLDDDELAFCEDEPANPAFPLDLSIMFPSGLTRGSQKNRDDLMISSGQAQGKQWSDNNESIVLETSPLSLSIIKEISRKIKDYGGAALIIDYGYFQNAFKDTFQAVKNHKYYPPLSTPGEADLTAHVDFRALAKAAKEEGVAPYTNVTQGELLRSLGIAIRANALAENAPLSDREELLSSVNRLIDDDKMGTLFKCIALLRSENLAPYGFTK